MSREQPALFRRFPQAREAISWLPLGDLPTPVQPLDGLHDRVAPASLWVKRDDLSSTRYGGNKVRALEFLLAQALSQRAERVLVAGALGSHFVSAAALFARQVGLRTEVVLWSQPWSGRCAEALRLLAHLGVPVRYHPQPTMALARLVLAAWCHRARGRRVALFPPGGASPLGTLGAVECALELAEQMAAGELPAPDSVWVACGSGGSAAGLALGLHLAGVPSRVRAVRVTPRIACNRAWLARLAAGAWQLLQEGGSWQSGSSDQPGRSADNPNPPLNRLQIIQGYYRPGYGHPNPAAEQAAGLLREQGLRGDTTYTGRALAALLDQASCEGGAHILWHTLSAVDAGAPVAAPTGALPAALRMLLERQGQVT